MHQGTRCGLESDGRGGAWGAADVVAPKTGQARAANPRPLLRSRHNFHELSERVPILHYFPLAAPCSRDAQAALGFCVTAIVWDWERGSLDSLPSRPTLARLLPPASPPPHPIHPSGACCRPQARCWWCPADTTTWSGAATATRSRGWCCWWALHTSAAAPNWTWTESYG